MSSVLDMSQCTVLGPPMFLLYANDIGEGVNSKVNLFTDDCLLYRTIESASDTKQLQEDLSKMTEWSKKWQSIHGYDLLSHSGLIS
jgi:hypothetical protein